MNKLLKPCPFCGGNASIVKNSFPPRNKWRHPSCDNNDCPGHIEEQDEQGGTNCDYLTDEQAIELWNKRAVTPIEAAAFKLMKAIGSYGDQHGLESEEFEDALIELRELRKE